MDTVDADARSQIMSKVGQKDTGAEMVLRRALHGIGLRYRLHDRTMPGSPDLVFPKYGAVIFVHGCYWHCHGCYRSTIPKTRRRFWLNKFEANRARDERNTDLLLKSGWRVLIVWECSLIGRTCNSLAEVARTVEVWLQSRSQISMISGMST